MKNSSVIQLCLVIITTCLVFYVLQIGADLIIPFIIALLLSLAIISLSNFFKKKLNKVVSFILSIGVFIGIFWIIGSIINSNVGEIVNIAPDYKIKLIAIVDPLFEKFDSYQLDVFKTKIEATLNNINFSKIITGIASAITSIASNAGLIFFYVIFILLEYRYFRDKMNLMFSTKVGKNKAFEIIDHIRKDVRSYFVIKTVVSLVTAILSYILLKTFGADFALFWAFLIFMFNYIPTVGSIIAVTFPILFAFIQFGLKINFFVISIGLGFIQILMGNIVEPKFMGNKLNLSPLVIIISLAFWGTLWGVVGMLLSVPIMVIINIILSNIKTTKPIAILLSEKGEIKTNFGSINNNKVGLIKKIRTKLTKK